MDLNEILRRETKNAIGISVEEIVDSLEGSISTRLGFEPDTNLKPYREARQKYETGYFGYLQDICGGNVTEVARRSGLSRKTVTEKLRLYDIEQGYIRQQIIDSISQVKEDYRDIFNRQALSALDSCCEGIHSYILDQGLGEIREHREAIEYFDSAYLEPYRGMPIKESAAAVNLEPRTYRRKVA